ncbi:ABC transporter permease [soil metagenome]
MVRHAVARSVRDWPVVSAAWLLLICAMTLLTTATHFAGAVAVGGVRDAIAGAPVADRAILVTVSATSAEGQALDGSVVGEIEAALGATGGTIARVVRSSTLVPIAGGPVGADGLTGLASYEDLALHAALTAGNWPEPGHSPRQAVVRADVAEELELSVGDRLSFQDPRADGPSVDLELVGQWRPDRGDAYWVGPGGDESAPDQPRRLSPIIPFDDLAVAAASSRLDIEWRASLALERLEIADLPRLRSALARLQAALTGALPSSVRPTVRTALPATIAEAERSVTVTGAGFTALMAQFALLGGYAVTLVAGFLLERRRSQMALVIARGGAGRHLSALAAAEAVVLVVPATMLAIWLPSLIVPAIPEHVALGTSVGAATAIGSDVLIVAVASAAGAVLGFMLPSLTVRPDAVAIQAALARPARRTLAQRVGLDVAVIGLAALGLFQLRLYGAPLVRDARGALGGDPLLVVTPALTLLAGSILALRILPRIGELAERAVVRRRSLVAPLWARQLARRPLRYTRSALLLMLAVALATFASAYASTWARSQSDQAAYQAVADARVRGSAGDLPPWSVGAAYRTLPGVEAASPAFFQPLRVGRSVTDGELLAVTPEAAARVLTQPVAASTSFVPLLDRLAQERPTTTAQLLADRFDRLLVTLDVSLTALTLGGDPLAAPPWLAVEVTAAFSDGDGRIHRLRAEDAASSEGIGQPISVLLDRAAQDGPLDASYPLALVGIELAVTAPPGASDLSGTLEIRAVEAGESGSERLEPISLAALGSWRWWRESQFERGPVMTDERALRIVIGDEGLPIAAGSSVDHRLAAGQTVPGPVPAIVSEGFLDATGTGPSDVILVDVGGEPVELAILESSSLFPPLDPDRPFVIVDTHVLSLDWYADSGNELPSGEWWLALDDARASEVAETLRGAAGSTDVSLRTDVARSLAGDPVALALIGALGLGALAALLLAAIGFLLSVGVAIAERVEEIAILRALGASRREVGDWLTVDGGVLLGFGITSGLGLGLLLAWLVLPFAALTQSGAASVPAPQVIVPLEIVLGVLIVAGALMMGLLLVVWGQLRSQPIARILRDADA